MFTNHQHGSKEILAAVKCVSIFVKSFLLAVSPSVVRDYPDARKY